VELLLSYDSFKLYNDSSNTVKDDSLITPRNPTSVYGKDNHFHCQSSYGTKWYHNSKKSSPISIDEEFLKLISVQQKDEGVYYCFGTYLNKKTFLAKTTLSIYGK